MILSGFCITFIDYCLFSYPIYPILSHQILSILFYSILFHPIPSISSHFIPFYSISHHFIPTNSPTSIQSNYPLILLLRVLRRYLLFRIVPQLRQLSLHQRRAKRGDKARGHNIQQRWLRVTPTPSHYLRVLKRDHHHHRDQQSQRIENAAGVEVRLAPIRALRRVFAFFARVVRVERQQKGNKEPRNHHIAQTQHAEALTRVFHRSGKRFGEHELDGTLHAGRHFHHDFRTEDPENIVEEETSKQ